MELDYAGDLTPKQAWTLLKEDKNCQLIDCRSATEWSLVGVPELDSLQKSPIFVEWQIFPMMEKNPKFFKEISENINDKSTKIILLCRSGARSRSAAEFLTAQGFKECYNCVEGFEGNHNENGHRSSVNGWKFSKLPWKQG